jgi:hypothetical protein
MRMSRGRPGVSRWSWFEIIWIPAWIEAPVVGWNGVARGGMLVILGNGAWRQVER